MARSFIVRLISSEDHPGIGKAELLKRIRATGTDRYDRQRKQMFDEFYKQHKVDFFGTIVDHDRLETALPTLKKDFSMKTTGDRARRVVPDIAVIYKAELCEMIPHVYENGKSSDCFRFKVSPKEALESVRAI